MNPINYQFTQMENLISPKSYELLGSWIYKYNIRISNIRLKIKYYKLILGTIDAEIKESSYDYNKLNDSLKLINVKYDIQNSSILAHKKLIKNKYNVVNTIEKLENEEQFIIHEFYY